MPIWQKSYIIFLETYCQSDIKLLTAHLEFIAESAPILVDNAPVISDGSLEDLEELCSYSTTDISIESSVLSFRALALYNTLHKAGISAGLHLAAVIII